MAGVDATVHICLPFLYIIIYICMYLGRDRLGFYAEILITVFLGQSTGVLKTFEV